MTSQTSNLDTKLRLWQEALAISPGDDRVRIGTLRAAIALRRDSLALALEQNRLQSQSQLTVQERAALAESLSGAAERLDDLNTAQNYLRIAIGLRPANQKDELVRKLNLVTAEQTRRANNTARQPAIRNVIEQDRVVRARIPGGAQ